MKKIRWGIIGPGSITHKFAHDFQSVKNGELKAVASRSMERAQSFAREYGIQTAYGSYQQLYDDPEIDAVYVATPHNFHGQNALNAIKSGKAVLCEKPLTHTLTESKNLVTASKLNGVYLMEGMWTYFLPVIIKAQQWVESERIGKLVHIKSEFGYPVKFDPESRMFNPALAGGSLLDMGIYPIAMAWLFLQQNPEDVHVIAKKSSTGVDSDVNMFFKFKDATANLHSSFHCKLPNWTHVIGEKGYIAIPDFWQARECFLYEGDHLIDTFKDDRKEFGFNYEIEAVNRDLQAGKLESDIMPLAWSLKLQELMQMVMNKF